MPKIRDKFGRYVSSGMKILDHPPTGICWTTMKQRCTNPKHDAYPWYGGRGITVCKRWMDSLAAFVEDMGLRPEGKQLDRIDNSKGYEPGNCRWATKKENARNARSNWNITWNGTTRTLSEWAEITGIRWSAIWVRIKKLNWPIEKALTTPTVQLKRRKKRLLTYNGESLTVAEWSRRTGLKPVTITMRLVKSHWNVKKALTTPVQPRTSKKEK